MSCTRKPDPELQPVVPGRAARARSLNSKGSYLQVTHSVPAWALCKTAVRRWCHETRYRDYLKLRTHTVLGPYGRSIRNLHTSGACPYFRVNPVVETPLVRAAKALLYHLSFCFNPPRIPYLLSRQGVIRDPPQAPAYAPRLRRIQGYLAPKEQCRPRTLQWGYA